MTARGHRITLFVLCLVAVPAHAHAEIHKCRLGERVIYQSSPCPVGSTSLTPPKAPPSPSAFAVEEARQRAKSDIAEAEAIWKQEEKAAAARAKARATLHKQEAACARLRDQINKAQAVSEPSRSQKKTLKREQRKHHKLCGPP